MVDAGAPEYDPLSVDAQAALAVAGDGAHPKGDLPHILPEGEAAGITLGVIGAPQLGAGERDVRHALGLAMAFRPGQLPAAVQNLNLGGAAAGQGDRHPDGRGDVAQGLELQTVEGDVVWRKNVEPHRAVDARAGVPAGVGLVGVAGDDLDVVFPARTD